jgi:aspartate/methionine/tyrosine aminotransferase
VDRVLPAGRYLEWARAHGGRAPFDLSISGMPSPAADDAALGRPATDDDLDAWPKLIAALAHYLARPEAEIVPALGTAHAVWLACAAALRPGDEALVEAPVYQPLAFACAQVGARVVSFERPAPSFAVDIDRVLAALGPRTRLVTVSNLHNPTGVRVPDETLADLASALETRGVVLHVDEVYAPFDEVAGDRGIALDASGRFARSACRLGHRVIATGSLTKVYGLGPARIGYVAAPTDLAARAHDLLEATVGSLPTRWATFALHGLSRLGGAGGLAERSRRLLGTKRARVATWMAAQENLAWTSPPAGLFGFARPGEPVAAIDAWMARALDREGVLVTPGRFFGAPQGFRLAWSIDDAKLDQALERLGRAR